MSIVLVLALVATCGLGKWSEVVELTFRSLNIVNPSLYTDPTTLHSHVVYLSMGNVPESAVYTHVRNRTTVYTVTFPGEFHGTYIGGRDDGRTLFIVVYNYKVNGSLWFTESHDDGVTWTPLARITQAKEDCLQYVAQTLQIFESGRLFMFYTTRCANNLSKVSCITKPPSSQTFSAEHVIYSTNKYDEVLNVNAAVYSIKAGSPVLHMFLYRSIEDFILYINSTDNGNTWSDFRKIDTTWWGMNMEATSDPRLTSTIVGYYGDTLFYSRDHGATFTFTSHPRFQYINSGQVICGTKAQPMLFKIIRRPNRYYVWDIQTMNMTQRDQPFPGEWSFKIAMSCARTGPDSYIITALDHDIDYPKYYLQYAEDTYSPDANTHNTMLGT